MTLFLALTFAWSLLVAGQEATMSRTPLALAQQPPAKDKSVPTSQPPPTSPPASAPQPQPPKKPEALSDAERIARLQRSIEKNQKQLQTVKTKLEDPMSEYQLAQNEFKMLDGKLGEKNKQLHELQQTDKKDEAGKLAKEIEALQKQWQMAKERANLAIEERKTLTATVEMLPQKIQQDQMALDKLLGKPAPTPTAMKKPEVAATAPSTPPGTASPAPASPTVKATPPAPTPTPTAPETKKSKPESKQLQEARQQAQVKEKAAQEASAKAQSVTERIDSLRKTLDLQQKLLETARKKAAHAQQTQASLEQEQVRKREARAPEAELLQGRKKIGEAWERFHKANADVTELTDRLQELQSELQLLQGEQIAALQDAQLKRKEANAAKEKVHSLQNPFTPHNILQWLINHGPKLLVILIGMLFLHRLISVSSRRIVRLMSHRSKRLRRGEGEDRAETLVGVFRNSTSMLIFGGGTLMLLDEIGIPIVPLMGGAAVFGLAVAFGAQNLIRDYFSGFMVLLEDQYGVNDVVKIGGITGKVERISLRVTVLRDLEGILHFVPHGTITTVSNMTHGWSRALFEIGVAYKEDADRVIQVLLGLAAEIRHDPNFGPLILEDAEMLGVDKFDNSSVLIKFFLKTKPLKQWLVKRELLRRIKRRFDEMGIEIPFPHRTVYHRYANGQEAERPGVAA